VIPCAWASHIYKCGSGLEINFDTKKNKDKCFHDDVDMMCVRVCVSLCVGLLLGCQRTCVCSWGAEERMRRACVMMPRGGVRDDEGAAQQLLKKHYKKRRDL
jgi:hypothetical protein